MKTIQKFTFWLVFWFVALFIISLPFSYNYLPDVWQITSPVFEILIGWIKSDALNTNNPFELNLASDSTDLYIQTLLLIPIALLLSVASIIGDKTGNNFQKIKYWFFVAISYYLALQLFKYGFDKVFKHQFYLPEPNILFSPVGQLSKDILYWSTIGASYQYSVFAGMIELIPAILLLFRRTRLLGAIIAMFVLSNVLMINLGFDISVKLYGGFLLFLSLLIISPNIKSLYNYFIKNNDVKTQRWQYVIDSNRKVVVHLVAKYVVIGIILFESLFVYFQTNNFNDDLNPRPFLHGAYEVTTYKVNNDTLLPLKTNENQLKRIFIHRRGYLITQSMNDEMLDYRLSYDLVNKKLILTNYDGQKMILDYVYQARDSTLILNGVIMTDTVEVIAKQIDLSKLPLLRNGFRWTVEGYE